jgi:tetratricopeptide (TPR) repeat protein
MKSRVALIHYHFGIDLFNKSHFPQAEIEFSRAIQNDSNVSLYYVRRADTSRYRGKSQNAHEDYIKALELNPNDSQTRDKLQQYASVAKPKQTASATSTSGASSPLKLKHVSSPSKAHSPRQHHQHHQHHHQQQQQEHYDIRSLLDPSLAKAEEVRKSYEKKNALVKEIFTNRPSLDSPSKAMMKPTNQNPFGAGAPQV